MNIMETLNQTETPRTDAYWQDRQDEISEIIARHRLKSADTPTTYSYEAEKPECKHEAELSMWRDGVIMHGGHSNEIDELKAEVERLKDIVKAQTDELHAISRALGTSEGHSSVEHIITLQAKYSEFKLSNPLY